MGESKADNYSYVHRYKAVSQVIGVVHSAVHKPTLTAPDQRCRQLLACLAGLALPRHQVAAHVVVAVEILGLLRWQLFVWQRTDARFAASRQQRWRSGDAVVDD